MADLSSNSLISAAVSVLPVFRAAALFAGEEAAGEHHSFLASPFERT